MITHWIDNFNNTHCVVESIHFELCSRETEEHSID